MKKISLFLFIILFSFATYAQKQHVKVPLKTAKENSFNVVSKSTQNLTVKSSLASLYFSEKETKGGNYTLLEAKGLIKTFDMGNPDLPVISKLIEVPQDANVIIKIVSYDEEIINLSDYGITNKIIPAQRSISKSEDPIDVPFAINENVYDEDAFIDSEIAIYEESGMMRATRLGRIEISPIQYNPVKNQLRILNNLVIEIEFVGANLSKTDALKTKYASPYFDNILNSQVINYEKASAKDLIGAPTHMVIVADRMFETQLQEFIEWKELKGFDVTVGYTDDIGTTTTAIKSYLQDIYEGSDPMEFVLFVGDVQQIPAWNGTSGSHVSDLYYSLYTGDDLLPEVYYGRFSAQTTAQLQPQIDKTLMYEQYTMSDPSYLEDQVLVAGVDAGNATVYGNGAINYISENYANSENGVNPLTYLYGDAGNSTVMASDDGGASASITSYMSQGVGWANYTAHCSPSGWYEPGFEISELNTITNSEKYGLWIGNCCLSVKFDENECFGEAALRKANAGAIGDIGGSNSTYWDEDYWWATGVGTCVESPLYENFGLGSYDAVYHTKANEVNDMSKWFVTQSQVNTVGQLAVEGSSSSRKTYYWEIYHLMGDPTVMNYLGVPDAITYTLNPAALMIGANSTDISTVPYGYIAVHQGGNRICVAMADENGDATLDFSSPIVGGDVTLVITAQNKQPLIETITPIASSEPYVVISSYTPDNANYNSTTTLDAVFENVADAGFDASNVVATLSSSDPYITIVDGTANVGTINGEQTVSITDAFSVHLANNIPDQHESELTVTMTGDDAKYTWTSTISIIANAPSLEGNFDDILDESDNIAFASSPITTVDVDAQYTYNVAISTLGGNNNGLLDPGENVVISFNAENTGHAGISDTYGRLSSTSNYVTINNDEVYVDEIGVGETFMSKFNIEVSNTTPVGTAIDFEFIITSVQYCDTVQINIPVGLQIEDFESGDFTSYSWTQGGDADWFISTDSQEGTYSAQSGDVNDSQNSELSLTCNVTADGTISFYSKVNSEGDYDFLKFYIDGTKQDEWSGTGDWSSSEFDVTAGTHTFKWAYEKDGSVSDGDDCAWIDYIIFPGHTPAKGAKSTSISATTIPTWLSLTDNGDGTAVLSGTTPSSTGDVPVVLEATDGANTVTQEFEIRVGVTSIYTIDNLVKFYPNPTTDVLNITLKNSVEKSKVVITDMNGKVVLVQEITELNTKIDFSNFAKGVYLLNLKVDGQMLQNKIIIE